MDGVAGGGIWFANQQGSESPAVTAPAGAPNRSAQPIRVARAVEQPIQAWVFAEGTARAVQREYLTFDRAGRVTFVKHSRDGGELRAGESVREGEVLARLDPRQYESEIDSAQAAVAEAKAQLAVAQTDIEQARTERGLAVAKFRRTEQLLENRATSKAEYEEVEANMKNAESGDVNVARNKLVGQLWLIGASVTHGMTLVGWLFRVTLIACRSVMR